MMDRTQQLAKTLRPIFSISVHDRWLTLVYVWREATLYVTTRLMFSFFYLQITDFSELSTKKQSCENFDVIRALKTCLVFASVEKSDNGIVIQGSPSCLVLLFRRWKIFLDLPSLKLYNNRPLFCGFRLFVEIRTSPLPDFFALTREGRFSHDFLPVFSCKGAKFSWFLKTFTPLHAVLLCVLCRLDLKHIRVGGIVLQSFCVGWLQNAQNQLG